MNIADALSGRAKLEGIRWMLTGAPRRALRRELGALLTAQSKLGSCRLRLARLKPGRRFSAFYDVHIPAERSNAHEIRPIAVTWKPNTDRDRHETPELAEMQAEAVRRGVAAPFRKLAVKESALGMHIRVSPLDVCYPQLVRLCDPRYVNNMIAGAYPSNAGPNNIPASRYSVTALRYRPGKRHVLRYDPLDVPGGAIFAKLYPGEDGRRVFRLAKQIGEWLSQYGKGVASVQPPPAYVAEDAVVLYPQALGTPLSEGLRRPGRNVATPLKNTGAALFALHQLPQAMVGPLGLHDFAAEVKEIAQASDHVCALLPSVGAKLKALLDCAQELSERLPLEPPTFTFGELKAEHVWVSADGLTLIDFDGCSFSDPALDLGKFLADLQFWCSVYGQQELRQVQKQFLAGYGPGIPAERLVRARLYEAISLVKLTIRRVRTFEPDWTCRTEQLIGCAQTVLGDLQLTLGLS